MQVRRATGADLPFLADMPDATHSEAGHPSILIDDPRLKAIPIVESGDPLEDVRAVRLLVDGTRSAIQHISDNPFLARRGVIDRLVRAETLLPAGVRLQVKEGWRPITVQARIFTAFLDQLRAGQPEIDEDDVRAEAVRYVAPPGGVPPHSTGGAVDVVLVRDGEELDMGSPFNAPGPAAATGAPGIARAAVERRRLMGDALTAAGFVNYAHEWWHWSYGDRLWVYLGGKAAAIHGPIG
ncbi:MAG TPA: M15 family metallopeptidase [Candidatus Saccharimonadales bacterium]|nr:M15 family metallopeptidase [Candidatus Saccharimonadales bacterium]